jgi:hypothetical protein
MSFNIISSQIKSNQIDPNQIRRVVQELSITHLGKGALASMVIATSSFADTPEPYQEYDRIREIIGRY